MNPPCLVSAPPEAVRWTAYQDTPRLRSTVKHAARRGNPVLPPASADVAGRTGRVAPGCSIQRMNKPCCRCGTARDYFARGRFDAKNHGRACRPGAARSREGGAEGVASAVGAARMPDPSRRTAVPSPPEKHRTCPPTITRAETPPSPRASPMAGATRARSTASSIRPSTTARRSPSRTWRPCSRDASATTYGRRGTPTSDALTSLSPSSTAPGVVLCPSGLSAISTAWLSLLSAGDHILITDSVYAAPAVHFADNVLKRLGVEVSYYDPPSAPASRPPPARHEGRDDRGAGLADLRDAGHPCDRRRSPRPRRLHRHGQTWATPVFFRPLDHGVDVALMAATKYVVGHSDVMMGTVAANARAWPLLKAFHGDSGLCSGPDDVNLALRGLRTMAARLAGTRRAPSRSRRGCRPARRSPASSTGAAGRPRPRPLGARFQGRVGPFSFVTQPMPMDAVAAMLDGLAYFGLGYSWGGFESLAIVADPRKIRTATPLDRRRPSSASTSAWRIRRISSRTWSVLRADEAARGR